MAYKRTISNSDDTIDSREVIERISELESELEDEDLDADERETLLDERNALKSLAEEGESSPDWQHGEQLIRDSYFERYAQDLADEMGLLDKDNSWPYTCIDWEHAARELQHDYSSVDYDGVTYWIRS